MKWVFEKLADGSYNAEALYKLAKGKGITCSKSNFWMNIRNTRELLATQKIDPRTTAK